jgi:hypothetical protein
MNKLIKINKNPLNFKLSEEHVMHSPVLVLERELVLMRFAVVIVEILLAQGVFVVNVRGTEESVD